MTIGKKIALVAHDERKEDLIDWANEHKDRLKQHRLFATGTTGKLISERCKLEIHRLKSGPLGGDQQLGAMIAEEKLDMLIFFWDPMAAQPHDVDVKALLRMAVLYNVPSACNKATADHMVSSSLFSQPYEPARKDYGGYLHRFSS